MYSEKINELEKIFSSENDRLRDLVIKFKVNYIVGPPISGKSQFILNLKDKFKKKIDDMDMGINVEDCNIEEIIRNPRKNISIFEIKNIVNIDDFSLKIVPEELLFQIRDPAKKRGLIYAVRADGFEDFSAEWMGIKYILPELLKYEGDDLDKQVKIFKDILNTLRFENLGLHSQNFIESISYLDDEELKEFMELISSLPPQISVPHKCDRLFSSLILLFFYHNGKEYDKKFKEFLEQWKILKNVHRKLLCAQLALELRMERNSVYECIDKISFTDALIEHLNSFVQKISKNLENSMEKLEYNKILHFLNVGDLPLPGYGDNILDNEFEQGIEKLMELLKKGALVLDPRDRIFNAAIVSKIIDKSGKRVIHLKGRCELLGMKWLVDDYVAIKKNYVPEYSVPFLISIADFKDEKKFLEGYGPLEFYSLGDNGNYTVYFKLAPYVIELYSKFIDYLIPEKSDEIKNILSERISHIPSYSISDIYINIKALSILIKEMSVDEALLLLENNAKKHYVDYIMKKHPPEILPLIYAGIDFPLDSHLLEKFKADYSIFEKFGNSYKIPVEISDELRMTIKDFLKNDEKMNEIRFYIKEMDAGINIPEIEDNIHMLLWYMLVREGRSTIDSLTKILPGLQDIYSYFTPPAILKEKGEKGIQYTPIFLALHDRNFYSIPYIFLEYGRESVESKVISLHYKSMQKLNISDEKCSRMMDYINMEMKGDDEIYHLFKGAFLFENGDAEDALKELDLSNEKNHLFTDSYIIKALILYKMERNANSIGRKKELLEKSLKEIANTLSINGELYFPHYLKGLIYMKEEKIEKDRIRKEGLLNLSLKEFENSISLNNKFSPNFSGKGNCLFEFGMLSRENDRKRDYFESAFKEYSKAMEIDPGNILALYGMGNCHYEMSTMERNLNLKKELLYEALDEYERIKKVKEYPYSHNGIGNVHLSLSRIVKDENERIGHLNTAIKEYGISMQMDEKIVENYSGLGNAYLEMARLQKNKNGRIENIKKAIEYFNSGLNLDSLNLQMQYGKAEAYMELSRQMDSLKEKVEFLEISHKGYEQCIKIDSQFIQAYNGLGNVFIEFYKIEENREKKDDFLSKAIKYFENAISIDENFSPAHNGLSICYAILAKNTGNREMKREYILRSIGELDRAISLDPLYSTYYHNKANRLLELSDLEKDPAKRKELLENAMKKYDEAISLDPLLKFSYAGLGNTYLKLALLEKDREKRKLMLEKSLKSYEGAISLDKDYSNARKGIELVKSLMESV